MIQLSFDSRSSNLREFVNFSPIIFLEKTLKMSLLVMQALKILVVVKPILASLLHEFWNSKGSFFLIFMQNSVGKKKKKVYATVYRANFSTSLDWAASSEHRASSCSSLPILAYAPPIIKSGMLDTAWVGLMKCQYYPRFHNQHSQCTVTSFERVIKT